jgi:hypothetical protein
MRIYPKYVAKALIDHADDIIYAIDRYLAKADDDLKESLKQDGYADPEETVAEINKVEDEIVDILHEQTDKLVVALEGATESDVSEKVSDMLENDDIDQKAADAIKKMFEAEIPKLATKYLKETDGDLVVDTLRNRTSDWINSWSEQLGKLMKISTHEQIINLTDQIQETISNGTDIASLTRKIQEEGWRNERYQSKRVAVTEVLRAHSVAAEESIQQSPTVEKKEWRHTGSHKNDPRPNHVAMDHQVVSKEQPFEMIGRDGNTYYPMYPRDIILPVGESANCRCIHRGIPSTSALGVSHEELRAMRDKIIADDNGAYGRELDEKNRNAAGITPYNSLDNFKEKSREDQIKYIGGKTKMELYDAGMIEDEAMLKKVKNSSLKALKEDGIFTVSNATIKHSAVGEFSTVKNPGDPPGGKNGGNMKNGGHSQANLEELASRGISYHIENTFDNGVRVGGVENHKDKDKRLGNSGQSWFPENWDTEKIAAAGTYVVNKPATKKELYNKNNEISGHIMYQRYDGVTVGVITDSDNNAKTIFPDNIQREVADEE